MISQDFKQRIKVGAIFLLQVYKVTTGTLLSLFIPQACVDEEGTTKICTLQENFDITIECDEDGTVKFIGVDSTNC